MKHWRVLTGLVCLGAALGLKGDTVDLRRLPAMQGSAPPVVVWAWEEPENLRSLDPQRAGVAFLAERIFLGDDLSIAPRRQRILVPNGVWAEAVVRVEARSSFRDSESLRDKTARALLRTATLPNIRSLQVDFDATQSQQPFYADVLRRVRLALPRGIGLSMTALVSWCSVEHGWMSDLPVDAAVPMYFRLGRHIGWWSVREPLCRNSLGVSTDEPWTAPDMQSGKRIYIFAPRPWTPSQVAQLNQNRFPSDSKGGQ